MYACCYTKKRRNNSTHVTVYTYVSTFLHMTTQKQRNSFRCMYEPHVYVWSYVGMY